ncbi:MAG: SMC-Scp complex subunit ScpB [Armatimonadota bacterium]|nr:SMC-Scp complex subunit ScpB [Armatimonadota bacterium]
MPSKADIIEALLFAADKPVPLKKLAQIAGLEPSEAQEEIEVLREEKRRIGALQIVEVAKGWQLVTKPEFASFIKQLRDVPRQRLSRAAFEVLAIVAYRQPVTRGEIEGLRGVDCAAPMQFLLEKKLIALAGRKEAPGRPWLYVTTPQFLDHFGLRSLDDLPSLAEFAELNQDGVAERDLFNRGAMKAATEEQEAPD